MNETTLHASASAPKNRSGIANVLLEAVLVVVTGAVFAFAANELSPRGLVLTRNYFPGAPQPPASIPSGTNTQIPSIAEPQTDRLKAAGLQVVGLDQVQQLFHDPCYKQGMIVFVDARDDQQYQAGHIPGAYQFDYYHPKNYIANVLPICQAAEQIVVYCTGGDCEDSEFTAVMLRDLGVSGEKLFVFGGGMSEWTANELTIEVGVRNSGNLKNEAK